nr:S-layer homology domain-containing protein [Lysinibacillus parviboronicapiens]
MIARTFELTLKRKDVSFSDVSTNHPYYEAIMSIQQAGIVNGSNGAFTPDESKRMIQERVLINLFSKHALFFACLSRLLVLI